MSTNSMVAFVYCGVAVTSAFILIYNAQTIAQLTTKYTVERYAYLALLFAGFASIFDCAYTLREMEVVSFSQTSSYIFTLIYTICLSICGTFWVYYSEKKQNSWFAKTQKRFILYSIPLYLMLLMILSSPITHWYFYFEDNHYQRGPLFIVLSTLLNVYIVQTGVVALIHSYRKENYVDRKEYRRLFVFALVYLIIQAVQLTLPAIFPYRSVGMMVVFEVFLVQNMKEKIGRDALTHINNRYAAERRLGAMLSVKNFELAMLDADKFKSINDHYGHQEGDRALQYISESLVAAVDKSCFVARMGGDEFLIINEDASKSIANVEDKINRHLSALLEKQNCEYKLTVSVGCALKDESIQSVPDLIKLADDRLYERKAQKKKPDEYHKGN